GRSGSGDLPWILRYNRSRNDGLSDYRCTVGSDRKDRSLPYRKADPAQIGILMLWTASWVAESVQAAIRAESVHYFWIAVQPSKAQSTGYRCLVRDIEALSTIQTSSQELFNRDEERPRRSRGDFPTAWYPERSTYCPAACSNPRGAP